MWQLGVWKKKSKSKIEPKNRKDLTEKSVNQKYFQKNSVLLIEPEKSNFLFGQFKNSIN